MLDAGVPDIALEPDKTVQKVQVFSKTPTIERETRTLGGMAIILGAPSTSGPKQIVLRYVVMHALMNGIAGERQVLS